MTPWLALVACLLRPGVTLGDVIWQHEDRIDAMATGAETDLVILSSQAFTRLRAGQVGAFKVEERIDLQEPSKAMCLMPNGVGLVVMSPASSALWLYDVIGDEHTLMAYGPTFEGNKSDNAARLRDPPGTLACGAVGRTCFVTTYTPSKHALVRVTWPCSPPPGAERHDLATTTFSATTVWSGTASQRVLRLAVLDSTVYALLSTEGTSTDVAAIGDGVMTNVFSVLGKYEDMVGMQEEGRLVLVDRANSTLWMHDISSGKGGVLACGPTSKASFCALPQQPGIVAIPDTRDANRCTLFVSFPSTRSVWRTTFDCTMPLGPTGSVGTWLVWVLWISPVVLALALACYVAAQMTVRRVRAGLALLPGGRRQTNGAADAAPTPGTNSPTSPCGDDCDLGTPLLSSQDAV